MRRRHFSLVASEKLASICPDNPLHPGGIRYNAWVFNGQIPGPVIVAKRGDLLQIHLTNTTRFLCSFQCNAGSTANSSQFDAVAPGESRSTIMSLERSGVFLYYSLADTLNGVWEHIADGLYGAIIVRPHSEQVAKEFYIIFSEIYNTADKGPFVGASDVGEFDIVKFITEQPDLVLTNGMAHRYMPSMGKFARLEINTQAEVFSVRPGQLTRWYILNSGPNRYLSFHFIGACSLARNYDPADKIVNQLHSGHNPVMISPGSGTVIETVFPEEGVYFGIDHNMANMIKGAAFTVVASENSKDNDYPQGSWLPSEATGNY